MDISYILALKCLAFALYFELEKMHSMCSAQRQVELRRLGNQLPVLGKANSLCKIVVCFGLFVPRRARVKDIPGYRSSGKIGVLCLDDVLQNQLRPWWWKKYELPLFSPLCPAFLFAEVDTYGNVLNI